MKLNWGTGIALFYGAFVVFMIVLVVKAAQHSEGLVARDYYDKDLKYQEHYDKLANSKALEKDLRIAYQPDENRVRLQFPASLGEVGGEVMFYRPSGEAYDFRLPVKTDTSGVMDVPVGNIKPGMWKVKVDWTAAGKPYYKEENILLQHQ